MYNRFPFTFEYAYKLLEGYIKIVNTGYNWGAKNEGRR